MGQVILRLSKPVRAFNYYLVIVPPLFGKRLAHTGRESIACLSQSSIQALLSSISAQ